MPEQVGPIRVLALAANPIYYRDSLYTRIAAMPQIKLITAYTEATGPNSHYGEEKLDTAIEAIYLDQREIDYSTRISRIRGGLKPFWIVNELAPEVLVLHGYNHRTHQIAALSQKIARRPLIVREEMNLLSSRPLWKRVAKQAGLRLMFARSHGLYIGSANRAWFKHFGLTEDRLFFTPYAVENRKFREQALNLTEDRERLRTGFGIPDDSAPIVLTVARLVPKKDIELLIRAFARVRDSTNAHLLIVGDGELSARLDGLVSELAVPDVHLAGALSQNRIAEAYACSDIFVLPSRYDETWGLVVNEAMNFGLPTIVSDQVGAGYDLVKEGRNGFVFPAGNVGGLERALATLIGSSQQRAEFGARSLEIIEPWNQDVAAEGVARAIAAVVGESRWLRATQDAY